MPWNDQNNSPWGKPGGTDKNNASDSQSPWGKPGGQRPGGGPRPVGPDLEDQLKKMQERFRGGRGGGSGGAGGSTGPKLPTASGVTVIAVLGLLAWASTGVFIVDAGEEAVIMRFGREASVRGAGFHVHLPQPIESHVIVPIESVNRVNIGFTGQGGGDVPNESLMLTGDENIVDIDFSVLWRISDTSNFLFNVVDPEGTIKAVAESAMREVVGKRNLEAIITRERDLVQQETLELIQRTLDSYKAGILITQVQLSEAGPPQQVIDAFRDVVSAQQDADTNRNQATGYRNRIVTEARGEAARILQDAEAYRESVVRDANGEAERFNLIYAQYRTAPRVTRERMYLETMERVLGRSQKVIIDGKGGTGSGVLPFLPLDRLLTPPAPQRAPAQQQSQQQTGGAQ